MNKAILLITILLASYSWAGERRGPGSMLRTGFHEYIVRYTTTLANLPPNLKSLLAFNADDLAAQAQLVVAECATEEELKEMDKRKADAYFFDYKELPFQIAIRCGQNYFEGKGEDEIDRFWKNVFSGQDTRLNILMVHEVLRTMKDVDDDGSQKSRSISKVALQQEKERQENIKLQKQAELQIQQRQISQIRQMLGIESIPDEEHHPKCYIELYDAGWNTEFSIKEWGGHEFYYNHKPNGIRASSIKADLLDPRQHSKSPVDYYVYQLKLLGCL